MEKIKNNKTLYTIIVVILSALALISLVQGCRNAIEVSQDFQWDATKAFTLKINPYDESLNPSGVLDNYDFEKYYLQMEANQFPSLLMILIPFTYLAPLMARYTWLAFNLFLTALMIVLLRKTFMKDVDSKEFVILSLLMIAGTPYRNHLGVGQHTIFAFTFFLLAVYFSEYCEWLNREKTPKAGNVVRFVLVTFCLFVCYFKYTLTVPLVLYFVYKKRYFELFASVICHVALTVYAAFWLNDSFVNMIIKPLKVSSALSAEGGLDISAVLGGSAMAYVLLLLIMIGLFIMALTLEKGHDVALMIVLMLWSLIVTYHRTYDFFVIVLAPAAFYELRSNKAFEVKKNAEALSRVNVACYVVIFAVFFVLRLFSENLFSKIVVGTMYYIFVFQMTAFLAYVGYFGKNKK